MSQFVQMDNRHSRKVPRILLYSNCVAKPMRDYLLAWPPVAGGFEVDVLLMHCMEQEGVKDVADEPYRSIIAQADFIGANWYSPKWGNLGLDRVKELKKSSAPLITWPPPNLAALWPVVEGFGELGVTRMIEAGATVNDIIHCYHIGKFDPLFGERWPEQILRLREIERNCTFGITGFCERNNTSTKLWFTSNHAAFNLVAWMGSRFCRAIGVSFESEEQCLAYPHDKTGTWNVFPETRYEFDFYQFKYPMRYQHTQHFGGKEWYEEVIRTICVRCRGSQ